MPRGPKSPIESTDRSAVGRFSAAVRQFLRRFRPPRRLKLTREGRYFIAITFGVGFVGILTANNLLYVLLGMLLSLIVVSGLLSEASLRDVRVTRKLPVRAQVGRPHLVEIEVHNDKKRMPSYAIEVEDLRAGQPADKRCFFLKVSPGSSQVAAYRRVPARRGIDHHIGFRVATRFPFGFFEKSREFKLDGDLVIYPAVDPVQLPQALRGDRGEGGKAVARGGGDEILGIRTMREGDDPRDIYWRRSVTGSATVVIERAREVRSKVRLQVDNLFEGPQPSDEFSAALERAVREVASHAVAHLRRGDRVTVEARSGLRVAAAPESGADGVLRFLALLDAEPAGVPRAEAHLLRRAAVAPRLSALPSLPQLSVIPVAPQLSRPAPLPTEAPAPLLPEEPTL